MLRLALLLAPLAAQEPATTADESSTSPGVSCEFTGTHIERLALLPAGAYHDEQAILLEDLPGRAELAPGDYAFTVYLEEDARQVELQARGELTVTPDGPNVFRMGAPLENGLEVRRVSGRHFEIDHILRGGAGEEYDGGARLLRSGGTPRVGIYCGEREVALEDFVFG
jgi:hypothetical protein